MQVDIKYNNNIISTISTVGQLELDTSDKYLQHSVIIDTVDAGINPSDATATANDILASKTAYIADGSKATGTIPTKTDADITSSGGVVTIPSGYYAQQYQKQGDPSGDATMTSGDQMLNGVTAYSKGVKYTGTILTKTAADLTASGATINVPSGYYASNVSKSVDTGSYGTISAIKGTVSNNSISVTPQIAAGTAGYNSMAASSGSAITVSASELVSGTLSKVENGTFDVTNYASIIINVPSVTSIYKIYDSSQNEIPMSNWNIAGLENAYYYTKNGGSLQRVGGRIFYINSNIAEGSGDKFYVYDNTNGLQYEKFWGWYGTICNVTSNTIGSGKTNTATVLAKGIPTDYTPNIWQWVQSCRTNNIGGCNDWYIGSAIEYDQLRNSGLVNWFGNNAIWSAVESNTDMSYEAVFWHYYMGCYTFYYKNNSLCCFCVRSF